MFDSFIYEAPVVGISTPDQEKISQFDSGCVAPLQG
jgi:hypothetical protein